MPRQFLRQSAGLLRLTNRPAEAAGAEAEAGSAPEPVPDGPMGAGYAALEHRRFAEAMAHLREATRTQPPRYAVWMGLAVAEQHLGHFGAAVEAYSAAAALSPREPWPYYYRGAVRLEQGDGAGAVGDFDRFLELQPDEPDCYLNRAAARFLAGDHRGAVADLDRAEQLESTRTRLYALRSEAKQKLGDKNGADRDRKTFLEKSPGDALSWTVRGEWKRDAEQPDHKAALADFDSALVLDPDSVRARKNRASLLSEQFGRHADALADLDRVLKLNPDSPGDRAGRAVLLARLGRTADALREVEALAGQGGEGMVCYQLASAALVAGDKARGLSLLRSALRKDPALGRLMPTDPDLKAVWKDATFQTLLKAAGTLAAE